MKVEWFETRFGNVSEDFYKGTSKEVISKLESVFTDEDSKWVVEAVRGYFNKPAPGYQKCGEYEVSLEKEGEAATLEIKRVTESMAFFFNVPKKRN